VALRTATSVALLAVLLTGLVTPANACALRCVRHHRGQIQRHCDQRSESMPATAHHHSAMNPPDVEAMSAAVMSQSCQTSCITAERLAVSRTVVPQLTSVQTGAGLLDTTAKFLSPHPAKSCLLDSSPPEPFSAYAQPFSILRI
jgi:hypothetical protein